MPKLVISYSHVDQALVRSLVALISGAYPDVNEAVFWDADLVPGEMWFEQIKQHIDTAPQLFVCWCSHSAASAEVQREYAYALAAKKRVVPVLMDRTPLVAELSPIHGIDVRPMIRHGSHRTWAVASVIVTALLVASFATALFLRTGRPDLTSTRAGSALPPPPPTTTVAKAAPDHPSQVEARRLPSPVAAAATDRSGAERRADRLEQERATYLRLLRQEIERPEERPTHLPTAPGPPAGVRARPLEEIERKLSTASAAELPDALATARQVLGAPTASPATAAGGPAPTIPGSANATPPITERHDSGPPAVLLSVLALLGLSLLLLVSGRVVFVRRRSARVAALNAFARELGVSG